jgi:hypothetical protein
MKNITHILCLCLISLALPIVCNAQTENTVARTNLQAYCLGPKLPYEDYPRAVVEKIQADLFEIYHEDPEWKTTAAQSGNPLNDGLMGPITWSWMQRVCHGFALQKSVNLVTEFPDKVARAAQFAKQYPTENIVLVSEGLVAWVYAQQEPLLSQFQATLYQEKDQDLLGLVRRYLARNNPQIVKPAAPLKTQPYSIYVLRADDFPALKQPNTFPLAINSLVNQPFVDETAANTAITKALKDQPKALQVQATSLIQQKLELHDSYQLTDKVLDGLINAGVTEPLFSELKKLSPTNFDKRELFSDAVTAAISKSKTDDVSVSIGQDEKTAAESSSVQPTTSGASEADSVTLFRIINASKTNASYLTKDNADAIIKQLSPGQGTDFPVQIIDLLKNLQDMEYPEPELLHSAIQDRLVRGLGVCILNKANTLDGQEFRMDADQQKKILPELIKTFPFLANLPAELKVCNEVDYENVRMSYDAHIRAAIEKVYRENMPAFKGLEIQWSGKECGCVPKEMGTLAYGIYPYWYTGKEIQHYDFSTFARVAYMGLTFNDIGQLQQINAENQAQTFLNKPSGNSADFIRVARTYGSKVDWMIEKDWGSIVNDSTSGSTGQIANTLDRLRSNITNLLSKRLDDPFSALKPILSLGLTRAPSNGDGVTLYFQNYPNSDQAKTDFDAFFIALKDDLNKLSEKRNATHPQKENLYLNVVVNQKDFTQTSGVFSSDNLERLTGVSNYTIQKLSQIEMQEQVRSLILVLLTNPYYNSLDEIYAITPEASRSLVVPVMFSDYKNMEAISGNELAKTTDDRFKKLAYIHESFGGGGFWPMTTIDKNGMEGFNRYLSAQFAPGRSESLWYKVICTYRWIIISIMNIGLVIAIILVFIVFYLFPHQCKKLPGFLAILAKPIPLLILISPPLFLWIYLLIVDTQFSFLTLTSLIALLLCALVIRAVFVYVNNLQQNKPNRSFLLANNRAQTIPTRATGRKELAEGDIEVDSEVDSDNDSEDDTVR